MRWLFLFIVLLEFSWVSAQDLGTQLKVGDGLMVNPRQVPEVKKVQGLPQEPPAEVHNQDTATLDSKRLVEKSGEEIPEMDSIREKSLYHAVVTTGELPVTSVQGALLGNDLQKVSAVYRKTGEQETDCLLISLSVRQRVKREPDSVLQVVDEELRANPGCSCEIVKAAVLETDMEVETVVAIVKVAFEASPANVRLIAQCAIAACPEALAAVQNLLAQYEAKSEEGDSAKGEKAGIASDDEVAASPNPLDFPGGPDGYNITFYPPPLIINPEPATSVNP